MTTPKFKTEIEMILFFKLLKNPIEPIHWVAQWPIELKKYYPKLGYRIQQLTLITNWNYKMFDIAVWTNTIFAIYMT